MKYFTSYYANFKKIPTDYLCIGISRYRPDGFSDGRYPNFIWFKENFLAPSENTLNGYKEGILTKEQYCEDFVNQVVSFFDSCGGFEKWKADLEDNFSKYDAIVFMCYERPEDFCHRKIVSRLFNHFGTPCEELVSDAPKPTINKETVSYELF